MCHGKTPIMPDVDGSDPYSVSIAESGDLVLVYLSECAGLV